MLLRILGVWLLLLAMVAAVIDATKSLAGGGAWVVTPLGEQWKALNAQTLTDFEAWLGTVLGAWIWQPAAAAILAAPTWLVFGILGVFLYWLGQKRKPVEIFIN